MPKAVSSAEVPTAARRPFYTVLETERSAREVDMEPPPWRAGLRAALMEMRRD